MRKQFAAAGLAALISIGGLGACDKEDKRDVEEFGNDVEEGVEDAGQEIEEGFDENVDTDGQDDK